MTLLEYIAEVGLQLPILYFLVIKNDPVHHLEQFDNLNIPHYTKLVLTHIVYTHKYPMRSIVLSSFSSLFNITFLFFFNLTITSNIEPICISNKCHTINHFHLYQKSQTMKQKLIEKTLIFLALLFLSQSMKTTSLNRHPLKPIFQAYLIQTSTNDHPTSSMFHYPFPSKTLNRRQVAIGLDQMQIRRVQNLQGWKSYVIQKDHINVLVVDKKQAIWNWILRFTVVEVVDSEAMSLILDQLWEVQQQQEDGVNSYLRVNNQKLFSSEMIKITRNIKKSTISPFILLTGISPEDKKDATNLIEVDLRQLDHNLTHITLKNKLKGVKSISYSIIIFNQTLLLSHSLSLSTSPIPSTTPHYLEGDISVNQFSTLQFYGLALQSQKKLKEDDFIGSNVEYIKRGGAIEFQEDISQLRIQIDQVLCRGYWSVSLKQCLTKCLHYSQVGQLSVCQDEQQVQGKRLLWGSSTTATCPSSILNCQACVTNFGSSNIECSTCVGGYYRAGTGGICQACPAGCSSCYYLTFLTKHAHCNGCHPTFYYNTNSPHNCLCTSNQYISSSTTPPTCVICPSECSVCSSQTVCSSCTAGNYLSGSSCLPCMPVCKTCTSGLSCSSCKTGLVVSGTQCICSTPLLLNPGTQACQSCITFDANCVTCAYSPSYSASSPVPVVCSVAVVGYYVLGGIAVPCAANCNICTSLTFCTSCSNTFTLTNGSCLCSPLSLTNTNPAYCDNCTVIIPGCDICVTATTTQCSVCISNYFPNTIYPTTGCTACPVSCSSCDSSTICFGCYSPFALDGNGTDCLCANASLYVNTARDNCVDCNQVIVNCQSCNNTIPTLCLSCDPGYSVSFDGLQCFACILNCADCNDTACINCNPGYTVNVDGSLCECDAACQDCLSNSSNACSSCTMVNGSLISCSGCAAGWFLSNTTCTACLVECQSCVDLTSCISCKFPLILNIQKRCECDYAALVYLTPNGTDCQPCASIQANCLGCETVNSTTICSQCVAGRYFNVSQGMCVLCDFPCLACQGAGTYCDSCQVTYSHSPGTCYCDNSTQMFYSDITLGCLSCSYLIPHCANCQNNANDSLQTDCLACSDPYYSDLSTNTCIQCDPTCLSCTGPASCSSCATNLIGNGTHCYCNLTADPTLAYYSTTNVCVPCLSLISNCLSCNPEPLNCTLCTNGTYLNDTICLNCATECLTCDSLGCLSCPTGTTLQGQQCLCGSQCLGCQLTVPNCMSCTTDASGVMTNCYSCLGGFELGTDGISCVSCPSGCSTCSGGGVCHSCLSTFHLVGTTCECDASLNFYRTSKGCQLCGDYIYGCIDCSQTGGTTTCVTCKDGMYTNGTQCSFCDSNCLTCSSQFTCTACPTGLTLDLVATCNCGVVCANCNINVANCTSCQLTILGPFAQCSSCLPGNYLNASSYLCETCPSPCITCDSDGNCSSCGPTLEVIDTSCSCSTAKGLMMSALNGLCEACNLYYQFCATCQSNSSVSIGYSCVSCDPGYYWFNQTCSLQECGDGIISPSEECDDANYLSEDGCAYCAVENFYSCTQEPSVCLVISEFQITFDSVEVSTTDCNIVYLFFRVNPLFNSYNSANFSRMFANHNQSRLVPEQNSFIYSEGYVAYKFKINDDVVGLNVLFLFTPRFLGIPQTLEVPLFRVYVTIPESLNSVQLKYQSENTCKSKEIVNQYVDIIQYTSFGILGVGVFTGKIVGLQLFGVLQISVLSLGSIDHLNPLLSSLTKLSPSNGYSLQLDNKQSTNTRLLQTSALTSNRVQTIGYAANFLRNCNLMLWVVLIAIVISFSLYLLTNCCFNSCLKTVARRLLKELVLTLVLFNCFNFSYCTGLHFAYADRDDSLFFWGTVAAIASLVLPFLMVVLLQCSEEDGFGEYKDKLRKGKLERAYFMITIGYRTGIGFYLATANEDDLSTLLVLAMSLAFLLYNLVNLPFSRAYHNYRACLCHLTQFLVLFVTMYYRSMKSGSSAAELDSILLPVYLWLGTLGLCVLVSVLVLIVEICVWVAYLRASCENGDTDDDNILIIGNDTQSCQEQNKKNVKNGSYISSQQLSVFQNDTKSSEQKRKIQKVSQNNSQQISVIYLYE